MHRHLIAAATLATVALLAACSTPASPGGAATQAATATGSGAATEAAGGGTGGAGGSTLTDPCKLLTQAEVSAVIGKQVGPGSNATNPNSCDFQFPADGMPDIQAGVAFSDGSLGDYCTPPNVDLGMTVEAVSGVGDGACFIHVGKLEAGSNLTFVKNGRVFSTYALLGNGATPSDIEAADKALALDALARL